MERNRKKIRSIYYTIFILGSFIVGVGTAALNLNEIVYILWISTMVLGVIVIDLLWFKELNKKLNALSLILIEQCDPDQYINEINKLLEGKRSLQLRQIRLINLGAAYCDKKDYEMAKSLFLQVKPSKLIKLNKVIYWADLALVHFYLKEEEAARAIMTKYEDDFHKFKDQKQCGDTLAILSIFYLLSRGEDEKAKQQLDEARGLWENKRNTSDFVYLESLIKCEVTIND